MTYNSHYSYQDKAKKYGEKYNLKMRSDYPGWNDEVDAFRHAFMQSLMYIHGEKSAKFIGDAYENIAGFMHGQSKGEKNMDLWNNKIGREIGEEIKKEFKGKNYSQQELEDAIAAKIAKRMKNGELITSPDDKRKYTGFAANIQEPNVRYTGKNVTPEELESLSPKDRLIYENEINLALTDDDEAVDRYIEQHYNGEKYTKENLEKAVASGDVIYVEEYNRTDGTKVSGYYRRK